MSIKSLRHVLVLKPVFTVRDWIMDKTGLFLLKRKVKYFFFLKRLVHEDRRKKKDVSEKIMSLPDGLISSKLGESDFVLSLTSYGKRVESSLPFTLYSLVTQTLLPRVLQPAIHQENHPWYA